MSCEIQASEFLSGRVVFEVTRPAYSGETSGHIIKISTNITTLLLKILKTEGQSMLLKTINSKILPCLVPNETLWSNIYGKEIQKRSFDEVDIKRDHSMTTKTCRRENEQLLSQFTMLLMATFQGRAFHSLYLVDVCIGGGG